MLSLKIPTFFGFVGSEAYTNADGNLLPRFFRPKKLPLPGLTGRWWRGSRQPHDLLVARGRVDASTICHVGLMLRSVLRHRGVQQLESFVAQLLKDGACAAKVTTRLLIGKKDN